MGPFGPRRNLKYDVIQSRLKECYYVELETKKNEVRRGLSENFNAFARSLCLDAYRHAARLNMRFCSCALARARLFMKLMLTYYIFSESAWNCASFETNFSFLRQFWFLAIFSPQFDDVIISMKKKLTYSIFSESAWHSASFESNFSFLWQFWFFCYF